MFLKQHIKDLIQALSNQNVSSNNISRQYMTNQDTSDGNVLIDIENIKEPIKSLKITYNEHPDVN